MMTLKHRMMARFKYECGYNLDYTCFLCGIYVEHKGKKVNKNDFIKNFITLNL